MARQIEQSFYSCALEDKDHTYTVWNSSSWDRGELVALPETEHGIFRDGQGNVLTSQRAEGKTWVYVPEVPAMGSRVLYLEPGAVPVETGISAFEVKGKEVETPFYCLSFNEAGQITRLYDKTYDRREKGRRIQFQFPCFGQLYLSKCHPNSTRKCIYNR